MLGTALVGLCRGGGHQEFAGVWFSYKWKPCVSLALHVPMSRAFMCLELVTEDGGKPGLTNSHLLLHPYCPRVSTLSLLFIFLPLLFCVLLKTSLRSGKPSYVQCLSVYFFLFLLLFSPQCFPRKPLNTEIMIISCYLRRCVGPLHQETAHIDRRFLIFCWGWRSLLVKHWGKLKERK